MSNLLQIKQLEFSDINNITDWLKNEGFTPGLGDLNIYRNTDKQGIWVGWLNDKPIGCIAGIRYNSSYGFIGLFIVLKKHRGNGYGVQLWRHALFNLRDIQCIGLEAAPNRINDYSNWGFKVSSTTTRWKWEGDGSFLVDKLYIDDDLKSFKVIDAVSLPFSLVQTYDASREPTSRPHFLSDWLNHPEGKVLVVIDQKGNCHGFGRIRPCLLKQKVGWRIGPLLADTPPLAEVLLRKLVSSHSGVVLLDSPGLNPYSKYLFDRLGFKVESETYRMYKGSQPPVSMNQVYGLACLELG